MTAASAARGRDPAGSSPEVKVPEAVRRNTRSPEASVQPRNLVVARFLDRRVLKGTTNDFSTTRPSFHLTLADGGQVVAVPTKDLKAVFFVRSLQGDSTRADLQGFVAGPGETAMGRKIAVLFQDGELVCGYAQSWSPERGGFFVTPADSASNNHRVFVIAAAAREIKAGPEAERLAERVLAAH
jgi:hypothetical protein